jgi:hypothetical protein
LPSKIKPFLFSAFSVLLNTLFTAVAVLEEEMVEVHRFAAGDAFELEGQDFRPKNVDNRACNGQINQQQKVGQFKLGEKDTVGIQAEDENGPDEGRRPFLTRVFSFPPLKKIQGQYRNQHPEEIICYKLRYRISHIFS